MSVSGKKKGQGMSWSEMSLALKILIIVGSTVSVVGFIALFGFIFMWLWNWIMPRIFHLPTIGYWEGWGLLLISWMLFHSKYGTGSRSERKRKRELKAKIQEMEDEEPEEEKNDEQDHRSTNGENA